MGTTWAVRDAGLRAPPCWHHPDGDDHARVSRADAVNRGLVARRHGARIAALAHRDGMVYPYATRERLELVGGVHQAWAVLKDRSAGDADGSLAHRCLEALSRGAADDLDPLVRKWAEIGSTLGRCASAGWQARFSERLRASLDRAGDGVPPGLGLALFPDLVELADERELAGAELADPRVATARRLAVEHAVGLAALAHARRGAQVGVSRAIERLNGILAEFERVVARSGWAAARHGEALRWWIAGHHHFVFHGGRHHHPDALLPALRPATARARPELELALAAAP